MFQRLFQFIEDSVFNAILRAFHRADDTLAEKAEKNEPVLIEAKVSEPKNRLPNGKAKTRK